MLAQTPRDPWQLLWQTITGDYLIAILLSGIAVGLLIAAGLPQAPTAAPAVDATHYARWFSGAQARFGDTLPAIQALGLFSVTRSFGFRALLALLSGSLLLRLIEGGGRLWQRRREGGWSWADAFPLLAQAGGFLLIVGLFITQVWGWRAEGIIIQAGQTIQLAGGAGWIAASREPREITHSPGVIILPEERGPGVVVRAENSRGRLLWLQQVPGVDIPELAIALLEDQYFAVPNVGLIVRLSPRTAGRQVLVQTIRSPSGRVVGENTIDGDAALTVDKVTLQFTWSPYTRLTAVFNPGLWPSSAGILLGIMGLIGNIIRPARPLNASEQRAAAGIHSPISEPEGVAG